MVTLGPETYAQSRGVLPHARRRFLGPSLRRRAAGSAAAPDRPARVDLLRDLVAEQLAEVLGIAPGDLDPGYDERGGGSGG